MKNRKIKFRVWFKDSDAHKMRYTDKEGMDGIDITLVDGIIACGGPDEQHRINPNESNYHKVMQYTGLKDKNGKDIYEGDIIHKWEDKYEKDYNGNPIKWYAVIEWNNERGGFDVMEREIKTSFDKIFEDSWSDDFCGFGQDDAKNYKVLGNIYENKNLIK